MQPKSDKVVKAPGAKRLPGSKTVKRMFIARMRSKKC